ncbi:YceI family protein [Neisseriaceae bacterium ESL0693]|nr:YceI family protein [Neisseriaceae bacterium ESL0693]
MRKLILLAMSTMVLSVVPVAMAENFQIDPEHTNARFAVDHFATSTNVGGFFNLQGRIQYDAQAKTGKVDITIPVNTLDTGRTAFNEHLNSAAFFNVIQYPTMRFISDRWLFDHRGKVQKVQGQLTLLGQTHPVNLTATKFNCYDSPMLKTRVCGGDFEAVIDRTQWGMDQYVKEIPASRYVKLSIQVEAAEQVKSTH